MFKFRAQGPGSRVHGLRLRVWSLKYLLGLLFSCAEISGFRLDSSLAKRIRICSKEGMIFSIFLFLTIFEFQVQGSGFRVLGSGFRAQGLGIMV